MVHLGGRAELGHLPEDRDPPAGAGSLGEVLERGAHGVGVGVVRVVDHEAAAGERQLLAAPGRQLDAGDAVRGTVERKAERVVGVQRGERIGREVPLCERELELDALAADGEARDRTARLDLVGIEPPDVDVTSVRGTARAPR